MKAGKAGKDVDSFVQIFLDLINSLHDEEPFEMFKSAGVSETDSRVITVVRIVEELRGRYPDWAGLHTFSKDGSTVDSQKVSNSIDRLVDIGPASSGPQQASIIRLTELSAASSNAVQCEKAKVVLQHPKVKSTFLKHQAIYQELLRNASGVGHKSEQDGPWVLLQFGRYMRDIPNDGRPSDTGCQKSDSMYKSFAIALGKELAHSRWSIIFGGRIYPPSFEVCQSFCETIGGTPGGRIKTYSSKECHSKYSKDEIRVMGRIFYERYEKQWHRRLDMVRACDIMLATAGTERTGELIRFADLIWRPFVPLIQFGGESAAHYDVLRSKPRIMNNRALMNNVIEPLGERYGAVEMERLAVRTVDWLNAMYDYHQQFSDQLRCSHCDHLIREDLLLSVRRE